MTDPSPKSNRPSLPEAKNPAHLPKDGGSEWNRLIFESSPYLLQHAANPVDWRPWGEEAFQKAADEDKPVFLSIGYATCHWCHVMEHESFEDEEVASLLNQYFVCIKVDKEERPDIDDIYMSACQAVTGQGGWPLTLVLTHEKKPFFAGAYFPKHGRHGRSGMLDLLPRIHEFWKNRRKEVLDSAVQITRHLREASAPKPGKDLDATTLAKAFHDLQARYDPKHGGFGGAPKFPTPHTLTFLLRFWKRSDNDAALQMVSHTLTKMRAGGIFDHVGHGFHRYATDAHWLLPHFEKMLYDQAMLAMAYLETYQATGHIEFATSTREIFAYVLRDLTDPAGGFYCAEDADSEGVEGKFYVWKPEEIHAVLGNADAEIFCRVYSIQEGGNFTEEATGHETGDNIPHLQKEWSALANELNLDEKTLRARIENARLKLFAHREERMHPLKDDKILTDWNGLMIAALAMGARILDEPDYQLAAERAADFILQNLRTDDNRLLKRHRKGQSGLPAHLDDYAFMIWGLLELHQSCFESRFLREAITLTEAASTHFRDPRSGAYFLTADDGEPLILRSARIYDGAIPSGNSVMAHNLARLARLTGSSGYDEGAAEIIRAFSSEVAAYPTMSNQLLAALDLLIGPSHEIVVAGPRDEALKMARAAQRAYLPRAVVLVRCDDDPELDELAPFTANQKSLDGKATAYVCRQFSCARPTTELEAMLTMLGAETAYRFGGDAL